MPNAFAKKSSFFLSKVIKTTKMSSMRRIYDTWRQSYKRDFVLKKTKLVLKA
jgi:hypothetical protein